MPEWLTESAPAEGPISSGILAARLLLALLFGGMVAAAYRITHGRNKADAPVMGATLLLLAVLIAMVSLVIGNSVARAFSLVGALSIVRFRTVVDDTRDTAFVIYAVIVGMAAGVGQYRVAVIGIPVVSLAALGLHYLRRESNGNAALDGTLSVRLGLGRSPDELLGALLAKHTRRWCMTSNSTARQGSAFDVTYAIQLKSEAAMTELVSELNQIEGVQGVELRRTSRFPA
jgi:hypothetical protein